MILSFLLKNLTGFFVIVIIMLLFLWIVDKIPFIGPFFNKWTRIGITELGKLTGLLKCGFDNIYEISRKEGYI